MCFNFCLLEKKHPFVLTNGQTRNSSYSRSLRWQSPMFSKESLFFFKTCVFESKHQAPKKRTKKDKELNKKREEIKKKIKKSSKK